MDFNSMVSLTVAATCFLLHVQDVAGSSKEGGASPGCPAHLAEVKDGYTAVHDYVCYLFVDDELYWPQARDQCYRLGGEMLTIESEETMKFIAATLDSRELGWNRKGVWLGLRHMSRAWRWTNGRKMTYENWADGEPSQVLKILAVEDCGQMRRDHGWEWHDYPCGSLRFHYNYICEFPLSKPSDKEGQVAPSAANQEEDNGNTFILILLLVLGTGILLVMLVIAVLLHVRHRCSKRRQAEVPVCFSNNHTHHNNHLSSSSQHSSSNTASSGGTGGSGSNGVVPQTCAIPLSRPPARPTDRSQHDQADVPFLYSEVNRARTPHLQMVNFTNKKHQRPHNQSGTPAIPNVAPPHLPSSSGSQQFRGTGSDLDLERAPLMTHATSGDPLLGSGHSLETAGASSSSYPPSFSTAMAGVAMAETQPASLHAPSLASSGDYVDMNSLITRERQVQGAAPPTGKQKGQGPHEEDKHTYTNVDHRTAKVENLYEVLP